MQFFAYNPYMHMIVMSFELYSAWRPLDYELWAIFTQVKSLMPFHTAQQSEGERKRLSMKASVSRLCAEVLSVIFSAMWHTCSQRDKSCRRSIVWFQAWPLILKRYQSHILIRNVFSSSSVCSRWNDSVPSAPVSVCGCRSHIWVTTVFKVNERLVPFQTPTPKTTDLCQLR